jgi:GTP-binding protein HflX
MERGIIVGVNTSKNEELFINEMQELKALCEACNIDIVEEVTQNLDEQNIKSYIGKGKLEELKIAINATDADVIICNDELSPSQISNLQNTLDVLVFDRTYVILEIFKRRAKTKEAILQVDIASLKYMLPRLSGLRSGFSRQRGAGGMAHGNGKGETQLEIDRRNISSRISLLKKELADLTNNRQVQRQKRKDNNFKTVCLVGYTNSGKSTTLNRLLQYSKEIKKEVLEKDMLFATLETSTRKIKLENNCQFLVTDTVGFVNKLPHDLIEAFKSTLEEIKECDLILHVVDASNQNFEDQISATNQVLDSIGVKDIPILYVFNKIDKVDGYFYIPPQYENAIRISSRCDININNLLLETQKRLFKPFKTTTFIIPYSKGEIINNLKENANVLEIDYQEFIYVKASVNEYLYNLYNKYEQKQ